MVGSEQPHFRTFPACSWGNPRARNWAYPGYRRLRSPDVRHAPVRIKSLMTAKNLPPSIDATVDLLAGADYLADRSLGTVLYLALKMGRPIFLEGEAGVGKTEIAKVLSQ